jgi:Domain of unknown function (DUF4279)
MGDDAQTKLSLHIWHPSRDLAGVCRTLRSKPKNIWKKGDQRRTPKGKALEGVREESYCTIEFGAISQVSLSRQIERALVRLKPHRAALRRLRASGGTVSFYVGWFLTDNVGDALSVKLLAEMARMGIMLELNLYPPG